MPVPVSGGVGEENRQHFLEMGIFALKNGMYMSKNQPTVSLLPVE